MRMIPKTFNHYFDWFPERYSSNKKKVSFLRFQKEKCRIWLQNMERIKKKNNIAIKLDHEVTFLGINYNFKRLTKLNF